MATCIQCGKSWNSWGSHDPGDEFCSMKCDDIYTASIKTDIENLCCSLNKEQRISLFTICQKLGQTYPHHLLGYLYEEELKK